MLTLTSTNLTDGIREVSRRVLELENEQCEQPGSTSWSTVNYLINYQYDLCLESMSQLGFESAMKVCVAVLDEYWHSFHATYPENKSYKRALSRLKLAIGQEREVAPPSLRRFAHLGADVFASAIENAFDAVNDHFEGRRWAENAVDCIARMPSAYAHDEWVSSVFGRTDVRIDRTRKGDPAHEMSGYEKAFGTLLHRQARRVKCAKWIEVADLIERFQHGPLLYDPEVIAQRATARHEGRLC